MSNYGAVRTDRVKATIAGSIESVKHNAALQNGMVFHIGGLATGEREAKSVVVPVTATLGTDAIAIHASVPLTYDAGKVKTDFILNAGEVGRAYVPSVGDIFTITDNVITGTTTVGQYVIPANASLQLAAAADLIGGTRFAAKVIEKTALFGLPATSIQVVKA